MALLEIEHLKKYFNSSRGTVHAVDDVTFSINEGETMGLVGESGCGKSTLGRTIIHLLESTDGVIRFNGNDVTHLNKEGLKKLREDMQIIFQDPYSSLNPRLTLRDTVMEPLKLSGRFSDNAAVQAETDRLLDLVGLEKRFRESYPHELDGGRRQRVGIARAIALNPKFVVCDEPVSALDVSIQAQILNLLMDLQEEYKLTYLFVTHDLSVVRHISTNISVMYLGQMVETAPTQELFDRPLHPYTKALLSAIPSVDIHHRTERILLKGEINSPINPKPGCRFAKRCPYAEEKCHQPLALQEVVPGHFVSCCRVKELNDL
ncbi:MAG: ABC transporter ATP-binding protein [Eubacteriales bacterium]|nr:ABC transporter ATP-binding protein [Eubacteriales bacterium]